MKHHDRLREILSQTRSHWDRDETRTAVREAFRRALQCRTAASGAEVYSSGEYERIFFHTCKARPCSSCGYRRTVQWQRERWAALPDGLYKGITFTMPDRLWFLFRDNPSLAQTLPALAAAVIQARVSAKYGLRVGVIAILHTFNGKLEFNSQVHTMVNAGGLDGSQSWISRAYYDRDRLIEAWRCAVIGLLRAALRAGQLRANMTGNQIEAMLTEQENRWWNVKIQRLNSRQHFLQYSARYLRRPSIAQRRISHVGERTVTFWAKDRRSGRRTYVQCSLEEFIDRWAPHIPERYQHAVRNFGVFAPRGISQASAAIFAILGQKRRPRPQPRPWADSLKRDFGQDPLLDPTGKRMKWARRLAPQASGFTSTV